MQASSWIDRPDCLRTISNTRKRVSTNLQTLWSRSKGTWLQLLFSSHMLTPLEICHLPRCSVPVSCVNGLLTAYLKLMFAWSIFSVPYPVEFISYPGCSGMRCHVYFQEGLPKSIATVGQLSSLSQSTHVILNKVSFFLATDILCRMTVL